MSYVRVLEKDFPKDEVCIHGRFVYAIKRKPLKDAHAQTETCVDNQRRLDARFFCKMITGIHM